LRRPAEGRRGRATPPRGDRLVALFLVAFVVFNPPLLRVFGADATVLGLPVLYVSIFAAWIAMVGAMALIVERRWTRRRPDVAGEERG
jgi:hypothetical protein